jgi:GT2 family glycosyltransferase
MKASVIVVVHAGVHHLEDSLGSLAPNSDRSDVEVVLVDNGSPTPCAEVVSDRWPSVVVVRSEQNLGFTGGVHLGAEAASGEVLILLNDDAAANDGFVDGHLEVLAANPQAAASAGRLVTWDSGRHDFVRGAVTFDCHAFQPGQGFDLTDLDPPGLGEKLPFACGGNMAIRREDWDARGGFDTDFFAYFEDVDLGWRLWAVGREVVAAPNAVARHRGAQTSAGLGNFLRGVLFERNALRTFFSCADDECRQAFGTAVLATYLNRIAAYTKNSPELAQHLADPFGVEGDMQTGRSMRDHRSRGRSLYGSVRGMLARLLLGPRADAPVFEQGHLLMQIRAAEGFFAGIDQTERKRAALAKERTVPDREIVARFPRVIVPTYPGDEQWFSSDAFQSMLPDGWALEHRRLEEIIKL